MTFGLRTLALPMILLLALSGCNGGNGNGDDGGDGDDGGGNGGGNGDTVVHPELDPGAHGVAWLQQDNFWLVSWSRMDVSRGWTDVFGDYDAGSYSMKLGAPQTMDGISMYPITVTGDTDTFAPKWAYIGADADNDIFGKESAGATPVLLLSANGSAASGEGFYGRFEGANLAYNFNAAIVPSNFASNNVYFDPPLTRVGYAESDVDFDPGGCEYFSGYGTICTEASSGPSTGQTHYEYWDDAAGPVANHFYDYYEDCLGFACNSRKSERRVIVWSFGDAGTTKIAYHDEPDSYAAPTPLPTDTSFFNMIGEVHVNDAPSGYIPGYNAPVGMDLAAQVHDWYEFEVLPGEQDMDFFFLLMWSDDQAELDYYLYSSPNNTTYGFLYLAEGPVVEFENVARSRAFSGTFLPGKYLLGVKRSVAPPYATGYGIMVIRGEDLGAGSPNPVAAPGDLTAAVSGLNIRLDWVDNSNDEDGFTIERSLQPGAGFDAIDSVPAGSTGYSDDGAAGTTYYYRVRATSGQDVSDYSNVASAPLSPTGLLVTNLTSTSATINWTDNAVNETAYELRVCTGSLLIDNFGNYSCFLGPIATEQTIAADQTSFTMTGLAPNTQYVRWLRAITDTGTSAGPQVVFTTLP